MENKQLNSHISGKAEQLEIRVSFLIIKIVIRMENNNKSGIYLWNILIKGKFYIGSSVNLSRRYNNYYIYIKEP